MRGGVGGGVEGCRDIKKYNLDSETQEAGGSARNRIEKGGGGVK